MSTAILRRRFGSFSLALPAWMLLLSTIGGAEPPQPKEPPGKANEKRWLTESNARLQRLSPEQRRRRDEAKQMLQRGNQYQNQMDYGRAEPLYRQVADTLKELLTEDDPDYLRCLLGLGVLCQDTGDYLQAARIFDKLAKAYAKNLGEMHPLYALALHNLGDTLSDMGDLEPAEPQLKRSLEIVRATIGEKNNLYTQNISNLSKLYMRKGDFARSEELRLNILDNLEKAGGKESPAYATELGNLATLHRTKGDYPRAEETLLRAEALRKKLGQQDWPVPGTRQFNLGALYFDKKDYAQAEKHLRECLTTSRQHFENTVLAQSERRQLNLARFLRHGLDLYLSLALAAQLPPEQVYEEILAFKGTVFAHQYWLRLARHRADKDFETDRLYRQLQDTARALSEATFAPPDPKKADERREQMQQLNERKEKLEAELAQRSATFAGQQALLRQTPARLKAALPSGAALLDFLEFHFVAPGAGGDKSKKREWHMLAVVVRPDRPLEWRDLGPARVIARACDNWRAALTAEESPDKPNLPTAASEVRRLVWQPLEPLLDDCRAVLLSPDGALASVPLAALPGSQPDTFLLEERALAVLPVPQLAPQILAPAPNTSQAPTLASLFLLGDVDFDSQPEQLAQANASSPGLRAGRGHRSMHFDRLAATAREIDSIRGFFVEAYPEGTVSEARGADATKSAFLRQSGGKRYLHLATHGFFAPPELQSGLARPSASETATQSQFGYHPGVLSGLALAGAGRRQATLSDAADDGILTALEVASLDLNAADLVVLSACETGLGGAAGGEGLLGLQRAFQIAGARSVLASLWKVDDEATEQLMKRFYANLWQKHLPPLEALRQAQLDLLRHAPETTKTRGPGAVKQVAETASTSRAHPRLWAAWVLSGDPGDLTQPSIGETDERGAEFAAVPSNTVEERATSVWYFWVGGGLLAGLLLLTARGLRRHF